MPSRPVLPRARGAVVTRGARGARILRVVCLVAVVATLLAGCSISRSSGDDDPSTARADVKATKPGKAASTEPTGDPAPAPRTDVCRNLTYGGISRFSNATEPVPCKRPHTAVTFDVEKLPKDVAFDGVDIGNDAVQEKASLLCRGSFAHYVGGSAARRALSRLSVTYFLPSQQDFDRGARWVRCDVIALQASQVLAPLPGSVKRFNDTEDALDDYGVCSRGQPGSSDAMLVMCNQEHTFRALTALRLGSDDTAYPGQEVVLTDGKKRCDDFVSDALGVGGGYSYAWTYPSSDDWDNGQRFGFCWNKTTN